MLLDLLFFLTCSCYYLSLAYLRSNRYIESSSLLQRCRAEAKEAIKNLEKSTLSESTESEAVPGHSKAFLLELMKDLGGQVDTEMLACKAGYMLELAAGGNTVESIEEINVSSTLPKVVVKEVRCL